MHNTLKKTINAEEQLIEHNGENMMKNTKEQLMENNKEQIMENKPLFFTRPKNAGALLLFALLALSLPEYTAALSEGDYTYSLINGGEAAQIEGYSGSDVDLIFPNTLGGKPVTEIGEQAFFLNTALQSVSFPASLTKIGDSAFVRCSGLTQLTLPDSLLSIGTGSFAECFGLAEAVIPASVTQIGGYPFEGCTGLTQISVHSNSLHFSARDGVLFNKEKTELLQYPGAKSGPYTLPGSVERIIVSAFSSCAELTEVTIPASVDLISESSFQECRGLLQINVHSNNLHYASQDGVLFNKEKTELLQYPCGKSGPYTLPDSVERIIRFAFLFCWELTEVTIPASVNDIGLRAFTACVKLHTARFEGHAPESFSSVVFDNIALDFKVQFYEGARGFTVPSWKRKLSESLPIIFPIWRTRFGFATNDLTASNGEPLLIAYALNLNPTNSAVQVPAPFVEGGVFRLDFPADRSDVLLIVERSTDLLSGLWESAVVETNSGLGSFLVPLSGSDSPEKLFLRFTAQQEE